MSENPVIAGKASEASATVCHKASSVLVFLEWGWVGGGGARGKVEMLM